MNIYISASWKKRVIVRELAQTLRAHEHEVFDFTDPDCRKSYEAPPEMFPEKFNPERHNYREYLNRPEWKAAVDENREAIAQADLIILLLPCGIDATADWALGIGLGKRTIIVGHPHKGESSEVHLWADALLDGIDDILPWLEYNYALFL
ncbi:hypothetical protein Sgly_1551 [Syntrophobotulus glycolicus DSM 8271]|uniref:Nucleoside 2-deoxyribosyltransferase n=1 Tax=Syntrophobotulus glycolicus (strain DSM 8271 / FlGlyR) TaxID=645991 RepID=F0SXL8_SYNGF|nr:hypothetical protein [Syntrophobotulus glycolicus]ADY55851.1 hypothetical protein Sgly_1551 [Syntrophobotulus glycolicus DSM 8271]